MWTAGTKTVRSRFWVGDNVTPIRIEGNHVYIYSTSDGLLDGQGRLAPAASFPYPINYDGTTPYSVTAPAYPPPNLPGEEWEIVSLSWGWTGNTQTGSGGGTEYERELVAVVNYPSSYKGVIPGHLFNIAVPFVQDRGFFTRFAGVEWNGQSSHVNTPNFSHTPLAITQGGFRIRAVNLAVGQPGQPAGLSLGLVVDWKWGLVPKFRSGFSENDATYGIWNYRTGTNSIDLDLPARSDYYQFYAVAFDEYGIAYTSDSRFLIYPGLGADAVTDANGDLWAIGPKSFESPIVFNSPTVHADYQSGALRLFSAAKSALVEEVVASPNLSAFGTITGDALSLCLYGDSRWWLRGNIQYSAVVNSIFYRSELYKDGGFAAHVWTANHDLATLCTMPLDAGFGSAAVQVRGPGFTVPLLRFKHTEDPSTWPADADAVLVAELPTVALLGESPLSPFWLLNQVVDGNAQLYITDGLTRAFASSDFGATWNELDFAPPPAVADYVRVREIAGGAFLWLGLVNAPGALAYRAYISYDRFQSWEPIAVPELATAALSPVIGQMHAAGSARLYATNALDKVLISHDFGNSPWSAS